MMSEDDLDPVDRAALARAVDLTLRDDPPDPGRVRQVSEMLAERDWFAVASFCAYHQQMSRLRLGPHQQPPCWLFGNEDRIIALGRAGSTGVNFDYDAARLTKRMLRCGVSPYDPDPVAAVARAKQKVSGLVATIV